MPKDKTKFALKPEKQPSESLRKHLNVNTWVPNDKTGTRKLGTQEIEINHNLNREAYKYKKN